MASGSVLGSALTVASSKITALRYQALGDVFTGSPDIAYSDALYGRGGILFQGTDLVTASTITDVGFRVSGSIAVGSGGEDLGTIKLVSGTSTLLQVHSKGILMPHTSKPASGTAGGTAGMVSWTTRHVYVCTSANSWARAALSNF